MMGIGTGSGKSRAREAALTAISSPLLEFSSIEGATGVVMNITGGKDLSLHEVTVAAETIQDVVDANANIIFGAVIDEKMQGEVMVTVIATGFSGKNAPPPIAKKTNPTKPPTRPPEPPPEPENPISKPGLDIPDFLQRRRPRI